VLLYDQAGVGCCRYSINVTPIDAETLFAVAITSDSGTDSPVLQSTRMSSRPLGVREVCRRQNVCVSRRVSTG
jgi:hypothetical protein